MSEKEKKVSASQSLFQIYYLGHTVVDRRCAHSVLPWIIEELKLRAQMKLMWLTPGSESVTYVADSGQELFSHTYGSIVRYYNDTDGISFAYIAHREKDNKYLCHTFQALTCDEAEIVAKQFKANTKEEAGKSFIESPTLSSKRKANQLAQSQPPPNQPSEPSTSSNCKYHLQFLGSVRVNSSSVLGNLQFIDPALERLKEDHEKKQKRRKSKKRNSKGMSKPKYPSQSSISSVDSIDFATRRSSTSSEVSNSSDKTLKSPTDSTVQLQSPESGSPTEKQADEDIAIRVTRATPERELDGECPETAMDGTIQRQLGEIPEENVRLEEEESDGNLEEVDGGGFSENANGSKSPDPEASSLQQHQEVQEDSESSHSDDSKEQAPLVTVVLPENKDFSDEKKEINNTAALENGEAEVDSSTPTSHTPTSDLDLTLTNDQLELEDSPSPTHPELKPSTSFYETKEVTVEVAEREEHGQEEEEEEEEEESKPPDLASRAYSHKRSLTVVSVGGTILNEDESESQNIADESEPKPQVSDEPKITLNAATEGSQNRPRSDETTSMKAAQSKLKSPEELISPVSGEFDFLPELDCLQQFPEFQALGTIPSKRVRLVFSGLAVSVVSETSGETIVRKTIRSIISCGQGQINRDCVGFVTREGAAKHHYCYLFKTENEKMSVKVLESFKAAFIHAFSVVQPAALCDSCPLRQLHHLCQSLEGVSTQVAQSRIQDCLATLTEADYSTIMRLYKSSEHADHEYTQIVVLVALLREHFHRKQDQHTHPMALPSNGRRRTSAGRLDKPKHSALERAKMALASSFDNLRTKRTTSKLQKGDSLEQERPASTEPERGSQSLNLPANSPLFSRKSDLNTLMSPVHSPTHKGTQGKVKQKNIQKVEEVIKRPRSRSFGFRKGRPKSMIRSSSEDATSEGERGEARSHSDDEKLKNLQKAGNITELPKSTKTSNLAPSGDEKQPNSPASSRSGSPLPTSPPHTPPLQSKTNMFSNQSFPPHPYKTPPPLSPISKKRSVRPRAKKAAMSTPGTARYVYQAFSPTSVSRGPPPNFRRGHRRSLSLRQDLFESCTTPTKEAAERRPSLDDWELIGLPAVDTEQKPVEVEKSPRTRARNRWRQAIEQQILLNRMEKQNESFLSELKLHYSDPSIPEEAGQAWNGILAQSNPPREEVHRALILGVPPQRRAEVWQFLIGQYQARQRVECDLSFAKRETYRKFCEGETNDEISIGVDVSRTFPSHPYFSGRVRQGQKALYNVLRAYAVADPETGYCQGLSFIAGILIMHSKDEEAAFNLLCQFMCLYNYYEVYTHDLSNLQMWLYELSRLLSDFLPRLSDHLTQHEIASFFYAAPWFLTVFASQYPISFVSRVLDLFFYEGPEVVFRIALSLLTLYEEDILQCETMESTSDYLKTKLPSLVEDKMTTIITNALQMDLRSRLQTFETEYQVMDELSSAFRLDVEIENLESVNDVLKKQNKELIEQLAICRGSIRNLETTVLAMQQEFEAQRERIERLEASHTPSQSENNS